MVLKYVLHFVRACVRACVCVCVCVCVIACGDEEPSGFFFPLCWSVGVCRGEVEGRWRSRFGERVLNARTRRDGVGASGKISVIL